MITTPAKVKIYDRRRLVFTTDLDRPLELGRQRSEEPSPFCRLAATPAARVIIAALHESSVSRRHLRIEPCGGDRASVANVSSKGYVVLNSVDRIAAGESRDVPLPILLDLGERAVRIEAVHEAANLLSLPHPTLALSRAAVPSQALADLSPSGQHAATEMLVHWLRRTMPVFQSAAGSADFLAAAAQAAADILGLGRRRCPGSAT